MPMSTEIVAPRAPASTTVANREDQRITKRHVTTIDEVDAIINEILGDEALVEDWDRHNAPCFDDESSEGAVDIDKMRLADMVKFFAKTHAARYPQTNAATTHSVRQAVQYALRRTGDSVSQRRLRVTATAA